jgi:hypothetical protein
MGESAEKQEAQTKKRQPAFLTPHDKHLTIMLYNINMISGRMKAGKGSVQRDSIRL